MAIHFRLPSLAYWIRQNHKVRHFGQIFTVIRPLTKERVI